MIPPPPGEAADGEEALPFPFPFGPVEGFSLASGFRVEEGNKDRNPTLVVVLAVAVPVVPLVLRVPPRVLQKEEKHGTAGVTVLAELDFERVKHHREEAPSS